MQVTMIISEFRYLANVIQKIVDEKLHFQQMILKKLEWNFSQALEF